jgi:hypothetical protein
MTTAERTLDERYESVHTAIMAGPFAEVQELVDSGLAWQMEGAIGRMAASALRDGKVVLPPKRHIDYYGTTVPSYLDVEDEVGSPGSVANAEDRHLSAWRGDA